MIIAHSLPQYRASVTIKPVEENTVKVTSKEPLFRNANLILLGWAVLTLLAALLRII